MTALFLCIISTCTLQLRKLSELKHAGLGGNYAGYTSQPAAVSKI